MGRIARRLAGCRRQRSALDGCGARRRRRLTARGRIVAQDDYRGSALLWGEPSLRPVPGETVAETRRLAIPAGTAPGPLDVAVGLYQPKNGRRVNVLASAAPAVRRRAAVWPAAVRVAP